MGGNCQHCFCFPSESVTSKRKEFAPFGDKFFPLRVHPFQQELELQESKQEMTEVVSLVQND